MRLREHDETDRWPPHLATFDPDDWPLATNEVERIPARQSLTLVAAGDASGAGERVPLPRDSPEAQTARRDA